MSTHTLETHPLAVNVRFAEDDLIVDLVDGRSLSVPLAWFPRLANATRAQLDRFEILADGEGIHWPELDEDLSVAGLFRVSP